MNQHIDILEIPTFLSQMSQSPRFAKEARDILNNAYIGCFKDFKLDFSASLLHYNYLVIQSTKVNTTKYTIHSMFTCRIGTNFLEITNVCVPKDQRGNRYITISLQRFIDFWHTGPNKDIPIILWVDRSTKYWQKAFRIYQHLGFRKPMVGAEKNIVLATYPSQEKYTFLLLTRGAADRTRQVVRQTIQTNLYRKLFISRNSLTEIFLSKIRYIPSTNQYYYTPLEFKGDVKKMFIGVNLTLGPITDKSLDGLYIWFSQNYQQIDRFLTETLVASPNYKILLINFNLIEVYYIKDVEVDIPAMIMEIQTLNNEDYKTLRNAEGEAYAVIKKMDLCLFDNDTIITNLNQNSLPQNLTYISQMILNPNSTIHPQPSKSTKIVSEEMLMTKIRKP